jgi:hypothetical protein
MASAEPQILAQPPQLQSDSGGGGLEISSERALLSAPSDLPIGADFERTGSPAMDSMAVMSTGGGGGVRMILTQAESSMMEWFVTVTFNDDTPPLSDPISIELMGLSSI